MISDNKILCNDFGRAIRVARAELDISQWELAFSIGKCQAWMSNVERGLVAASDEEKEMIMHALETALAGKNKGNSRAAMKGTRRIKGELSIDVSEAADFIGCSGKGIRCRVARGTIPYRRIGGRIIFLRSELEKWLRTLPGVSIEQSLENMKAARGTSV
jgi:DNA-binding XRE family transcriptional regulator